MKRGGRPSKRNAHADTVMALYKGRMHISDIAKCEETSLTTVYKIIVEFEERCE